jgi:hypothetical protein
MVRRGSTVRVRQRALQKRRKPGCSVQTALQILHVAVGMEPFMELSDPGAASIDAKADSHLGMA